MSLTSQFVQNLKRFRLVTFDVTDTLLRLEEPMRHYQKTAEECGVPGVDRGQLERCFRQQFSAMSREHPNFGRQSPDMMDWQQWWMHLVSRTFACTDDRLEAEQLERIGRRLIALFRTNVCWRHIEGGQELVKRVRAAGKSVGVISNFDPSLPQVLAAMGYAGKFDFVLTSYEAGVMKPDSRIFHMALQRLGLQAEQALHIGNKLDMDYAGARNSGWSGLLVDEAGKAAGDSRHTFGSLSSLVKALDNQEIQW
ncbi:rhythmically expressed gene 2 protein [Drosophila kikkawai]|uniref:Rhythmically expressed gene 2 protein n=1 Tax=Drosophila kikkawai TaxID=30033 RepID=A0A6P4J517_DROKI|nr:rhythmically expressed gene 2 protein [Drosophila kikkawai]